MQRYFQVAALVLCAIALSSCAVVDALSGDTDTEQTKNDADAGHLDITDPADANDVDHIDADDTESDTADANDIEDTSDVVHPDADITEPDADNPPPACDPVPECFTNIYDDNCECVEPTQIVTGGDHSCALLSDGSIWCWGKNEVHQVTPDDDSDVISRPVRVDFGEGVPAATAVTAGVFHNCATFEDMKIRCWGYNSNGQFPTDPDTPHRATIDPSADLQFTVSEISAISAGQWHTCIIVNKKVYCWGSRQYGLLGDGSLSTGTKPLSDDPVITAAGTPLDRVKSIATSAWHTCAIDETDKLWCWGNNQYGQLGDGSTDDGVHASQPLWPVDIDKVVSVAAGYNHTCATLTVDESGTSQLVLSCWGKNDLNQSGTDDPNCSRGSNCNILKPALSVLITRDYQGDTLPTHAGEDFTCTYTSNASSPAIVCWGKNDLGQTATNTCGEASPIPDNLRATDIIAFESGRSHSCGLTAAREILCWGDNTDGQLGTGRATYQDEACDEPNQPFSRKSVKVQFSAAAQ